MTTFDQFSRIQHEIPISGDVIEVTPTTEILIIEPKRKLKKLTINMPSHHIIDGQKISVVSFKEVLTVNHKGGVILGEIKAFVALDRFRYVYRSVTKIWYLFG